MAKNSYNIKLPQTNQNLDREEEYFILTQDKQEQKLRVRDYQKLYKMPGLYEQLLVDVLQHNSHTIIADLLAKQADKLGVTTSSLSVFELASGVGLAGEKLKEKRVKSIVGVDLIEEAAEAAKRDRPYVYSQYYVATLPQVSNQMNQELINYQFNCLVCASALTGGLPANAFAFGYNLVANGSPVVFNIREDLLDNSPTNRSAGRMIAQMIKEGILKINFKRHFRHRLSVTGLELYDVALSGTKMADIPKEMIS